MKILDARGDARAADSVGRARTEPDPAIDRRAREILERVRTEGDEALTTLTRELDCRLIDALGLRVSPREIESAGARVTPSFLRALRTARENIARFHRRQLPRTWELRRGGLRLRQQYRPLNRVGVYVPGGKAVYPSTVLMNAVPARIAGVEEIVMATPCNTDGKIAPEVLVAARECGITEIYRIGGAQAIAALAYGTESIRRVEKICGPGNAYVAAAKRLLFGVVGIDMIAGPTEIVVVADGTARAAFVAADMIAQAEHDESATAILITTSHSLALSVQEEILLQLESAPRKAIARRALDGQGMIVIIRTMRDAVGIVNAIAPEHVELMVRHPREVQGRILNAGSVFLGTWATEALGDYTAGVNHTLPTSGSARFSSPLSVADFMKFMNVIDVSRGAFRRLAPAVETLAAAEGLAGHAASVRIRRELK